MSVTLNAFDPTDFYAVGSQAWELGPGLVGDLIGTSADGSLHAIGQFSGIRGPLGVLTVWSQSGTFNALAIVPGVDVSDVFSPRPGSDERTINFWALLPGDDVIYPSGRGDRLFAGAGNDQFNTINEGEQNVFDGGPGTDGVEFHAVRAAYTVDTNRGTIFVTNNDRNSQFTLTNVERLRFADQTVAYDIDGNAGQAYRIFSAFHRTPDIAGLSYWTNQIDHGRSLASVAANFIASNEFKATFGDPATLTTSRFLDVAYQNILGRAPDAAGKAYWQGQIDQGLSRAVVLASFTESAENVALVGGAIAQGIRLDNDWLT